MALRDGNSQLHIRNVHIDLSKIYHLLGISFPVSGLYGTKGR